MKKLPSFKRSNVSKFKRLKNAWRKPRGIDNKQRMRRKSAGAIPKIGYRQARKERGFHPSGLMEVLVHNENELRRVSPQKEVARIAGSVGGKKRVEIRKIAQELKVKLLN